MIGSRLLAIYLNDHLAGATGGLELAKRSAASNEGTAYGEALARIASQVAEDRESLIRIMDHLGVRRDPLKQAGGWLAEKLGRAKLNGQLRGYSPLSRVVELEGLQLGVRGKLSCWRTLQAIFGPQLGDASLEELAARAEAQLTELAAQRDAAAREAFADEAASLRS